MASATLAALGLVVAVSVPWLYSQATSQIQERFPTLRNKRICVLIAHPDDEAMFFAPTVLRLTRPEAGNHVRILCLSTGNAAGLGDTRKRELVKSAMLLGLRHESDVIVVDRPEFPDSMETPWDPAKVSTLLLSSFAPHLAPLGPSPPRLRQEADVATSPAGPFASIDALLTFDGTGVSSHPNHVSLHAGAKEFLSSLTADQPGSSPPVDVYTLTSVPMYRKYSAFFDVFWTLVAASMDGKKTARTSAQGNPGVLVSVSDMAGGRRESTATARKAMTDAHVSQMVWFRWGWIMLSRYMIVNDLRLEQGAPRPGARGPS